MHKYFITLIVLTLIAVGFVVVLIINTQIIENEIKEFNSQFEIFNKRKLTGADISSVINKAINNNKKEGNTYLVDINIRIRDYGEDITVNMEKIYSLGIENFMIYYGDYEFECTGIEYDTDTKRVNMLNFKNI